MINLQEIIFLCRGIKIDKIKIINSIIIKIMYIKTNYKLIPLKETKK